MDGCKNYDIGLGSIAICQVVKIAVYGSNRSPNERKQSNHSVGKTKAFRLVYKNKS